MERIDVTGLTEDEARALITPEMLAEGERTMAELRRVMDSLSEDTGQTAYSSLMGHCPFCGGRAWLQYWEYPTGDGMEGRAVCVGCHVSTSRDFQSGRTTYLPTGEDITKPLLIKKIIETWNRRAERTCHYIYDKEICAWRCSECGGLEPVGDHVRYCPDCGARIAEEVNE